MATSTPLDMIQREKEWKEVEDLIMTYKKQFVEEDNPEIVVESKKAMEQLLVRFSPLFKKYITLLKTGQIDFNDVEMKLFVCSFIDDLSLQRALRRKKQKACYRNDIYKKFGFVKETYGALPESDILVDLQLIFFTMAKRYKQIGKSFCGYIYNSYRHEVSRHIKKFTKNPLNIAYKNTQYEDCINSNEYKSSYEDTYYEDTFGLPDFTWLSGQNCSEIFNNLTVFERKILIKYYLEDWNDRQISEEFGTHINTINQKRNNAINKIAKNLGLSKEEIKRNRKSGKRAVLPIL